jgi:hypothetical protein
MDCHGTDFTCNNGKDYGFPAKPTLYLHKKNSTLMDGQLRASALCRNHEAALWHSTHTNLYKPLVQGGLSLKSGIAIPRQRQ